MIRKRTFFSSLILVGLVAITSWLSIQEHEPTEEPEIVYIKSKAKKIQLTQTNIEGRLKYKIWAESAEQYSDGPIDLARPLLELHDSRSTVPWKIEADQATVVDAHQKITLKGHVKISRNQLNNTPPLRLLTNHLILYPDQNYAETDDEVTMEIPDTGTHMLSTGMKAYLNPEKLELISHIRSTYDHPSLP